MGNIMQNSEKQFEIIEEEVTSLEEIQLEEKVYNLQVEDDESYFADGICVHNCRTTTVIAYAEEIEAAAAE